MTTFFIIQILTMTLFQEKSWSMKAKNKARKEAKVEKLAKKQGERIPCKACEGCLVRECGKCTKCSSYPRKT